MLDWQRVASVCWCQIELTECVNCFMQSLDTVCVCVCVFNILLDVFGVYNALMQLGIELFEDLLKLKGETDKDR